MKNLTIILLFAVATATAQKYRPETVPDFKKAVEWPAEGITVQPCPEPCQFYIITPYDCVGYQAQFQNTQTQKSLYFQSEPTSQLYIHTKDVSTKRDGEVFYIPENLRGIIWTTWTNQNCTLTICYDTRTPWAAATFFLHCNN